MYKKILICLDNSQAAGYCSEIALRLASSVKASVCGMHVYAARLHDARFRLMEEALPPEMKDEERLERQRKNHETLIAKGLEIISDSYLEAFSQNARSHGIEAGKINREGRNFEEIIKTAKEESFDLIAMGDRGLGGNGSTRLGSVTERVSAGLGAGPDLLVARRPVNLQAKDNIICVAIDGSAASYKALEKAIKLAGIFNAGIEAISAYDVKYHQNAFRALEGVLSAQAQSIFKFKDQQRLHEDIIDKGLERVYSKFLDRAALICDDSGIKMTRTLIAGKPVDALCSRINALKPVFTVTGRNGSHATDSGQIGSTASALLREAACNLIVSS